MLAFSGILSLSETQGRRRGLENVIRGSTNELKKSETRGTVPLTCLCLQISGGGGNAESSFLYVTHQLSEVNLRRAAGLVFFLSSPLLSSSHWCSVLVFAD